MSNNPFVISTVGTQPVGASAPEFNTPLLLSYNASSFGSDRIRSYVSSDEVAVDFTSPTGPERIAAARFFSQREPRLRKFMIGRGANKPTQRYDVSVATRTPGDTYSVEVLGDGVTPTSVTVPLPSSDLTFTAADVTIATDTIAILNHGLTTGALLRLVAGGALITAAGIAADANTWAIVIDANTIKLATTRANALAGTAVDITNAGTGSTTVKLTSNDVLVARLVEALNLVVGKNYTAAAVANVGDTDTLAVTANSAGAWFSIASTKSEHLTVAQSHADPGIVADLAAISLAGGDWYSLHTSYNSPSMVVAAATWVESSSVPRIYTVDTADTLHLVDGAGSGSLGDALKAFNFGHTWTWFHPSAGAMLGKAVDGRVLSRPPGKVASNAKVLVGPTPVEMTSNQYNNLLDVNVNSYSAFDGIAATFVGKMASGEWWDVVRNDDAVKARLRIALWNLLTSADIVPQSDAGIAMIETVIRGVLETAVSDGIYLSYSVTVPKYTEVTTANRAARRMLVQWSAARANAVVYLESSGYVTT